MQSQETGLHRITKIEAKVDSVNDPKEWFSLIVTDNYGDEWEVSFFPNGKGIGDIEMKGFKIDD